MDSPNIATLQALVAEAHSKALKLGTYVRAHPSLPNTFEHGDNGCAPSLTFTITSYDAKTNQFTGVDTDDTPLSFSNAEQLLASMTD
jgi:hypothetical protein